MISLLLELLSVTTALYLGSSELFNLEVCLTVETALEAQFLCRGISVCVSEGYPVYMFVYQKIIPL